ncbi:transposase [Streptomyces sp. NPDC059787]|uniref:transposase n=1 Tax=Streptomyces sp. NPDC059787 TaxID=3346947 RepID=UPI0036561406
MGVRHFLATSDGEHVQNPRFLQMMAKEPAAAQRHLATFPRRTRRRTKKHRDAARKVAAIHVKIRRQRLDHHHKAANTLVAEYDVVVHEKPNSAGMTRSPTARPDPGTPGGFPAERGRREGRAQPHCPRRGLGTVLRNPGAEG